MKIGGLQPFTLSDYPGRCAAIFFTIGCNFQCPYCHNKYLWNATETDQISEEKIESFLISKQNKLDGIVITGGEPTIQPDLKEFIEKIKKFNYLVKLDTNGSNPNILKTLIEKKLIDCVAMDVKAPLAIYNKLAGKEVDINAVSESIKIIESSKINCIFRTTWDKSLLTEDDISSIHLLISSKSRLIIQECIIDPS